MRRFLGLVAAGGLWLGTAATADAQFAMSIGNPYASAYSIGIPNTVGYGGMYGVPYSPNGLGYGGLGTGGTFYSSGYAGVGPAVSTFAYPYGYSSYYGYAPYYRPGYYGVGRRWGGYYGVGPRWGGWGGRRGGFGFR